MWVNVRSCPHTFVGVYGSYTEQPTNYPYTQPHAHTHTLPTPTHTLTPTPSLFGLSAGVLQGRAEDTQKSSCTPQRSRFSRAGEARLCGMRSLRLQTGAPVFKCTGVSVEKEVGRRHGCVVSGLSEPKQVLLCSCVCVLRKRRRQAACSTLLHMETRAHYVGPRSTA